jgi:hypothetical protein
MSMLAEQVDGVIGVDTHRDTLAAAAVSSLGAVLAHAEAATDAHGYLQLLKFARKHVPGRRCWALDTARAWPRSWRPLTKRWWRSAVPSDRLNAAAARPTPSTRSAPLGRR